VRLEDGERTLEARRLAVDLSDDELALRRGRWQARKPRFSGGYAALYNEHVLQADRGVDFDFLIGKRGAEPIRA